MLDSPPIFIEMFSETIRTRKDDIYDFSGRGLLRALRNVFKQLGRRA